MTRLLHDLLIDAARRYPEREAVISGDASITYAALNERTDRLAGVLRDNGVKVGDRVGLYLEKSISAIVGMHAILKAGAAYVPLDPASPPARIEYIVRDCGVRHMLLSANTARGARRLFSGASPLEIAVLLDEGDPPEEGFAGSVIPWRDVCSHRPLVAPTDGIAESDLAYLLYTSGSTGVPKGVMISHLNALNFVDWARDAFELSPGDRVSNHAPLHFDLSIFDIFGAFSAGACVLPVPARTALFPIRLADWIEEERISVWYSVPSALSLLVSRGRLERHAFAKLRAILFAGEVFPVKFLRELMRLVPGPDYYNLYGPTETNVITYYKVESLDPSRTTPVPIGRACAGADLFALRPDGNRVASPGEEGELYARGPCVAQGYWNDAEKTASSFVEESGGDDERTYRTGDLVTLDEAGNWIYRGRRDHMVKSRGYRIELGEIEAALYAHPDVAEAAALAVPDDLIGNRIEAVVVAAEGATPGVKALRAFCATRLPPYMIPERIELRDRLPKTASGKLDRTQLSASL